MMIYTHVLNKEEGECGAHGHPLTGASAFTSKQIVLTSIRKRCRIVVTLSFRGD